MNRRLENLIFQKKDNKNLLNAEDPDLAFPSGIIDYPELADFYNKIGISYIFIQYGVAETAINIFSSFGDVETRVIDFIYDPLSSDLPKIMGKIAENWELVDITLQSY